MLVLSTTQSDVPTPHFKGGRKTTTDGSGKEKKKEEGTDRNQTVDVYKTLSETLLGQDWY